MNHRSIRKFADRPVSEETLRTIIAAAQMASSSSHVQAYSVIHVTDREKRKRLAEWAGNQTYVENSPVFLVWCADLYRLRYAYSRLSDPEKAHIRTTENLIVATVDTALAAQNAAVAAESLGLGIVYIGGIRNNSEAVTDLLALPEYVYPVFGMCLGYPDQQPVTRPRLPQDAILHRDRYSPDSYAESLEQYDRIYREYLQKRTRGKISRSWSEELVNKLSRPVRIHMKNHLEKQGFLEGHEDLT